MVEMSEDMEMQISEVTTMNFWLLLLCGLFFWIMVKNVFYEIGETIFQRLKGNSREKLST